MFPGSEVFTALVLSIPLFGGVLTYTHVLKGYAMDHLV